MSNDKNLLISEIRKHNEAVKSRYTFQSSNGIIKRWSATVSSDDMGISVRVDYSNDNLLNKELAVFMLNKVADKITDDAIEVLTRSKTDRNKHKN